MLNFYKPRRRVSQAPNKITKCHAGCGADVEYRTTPRVICSNCKAARKREQSRKGMERQRRKRGIPKIKGKTKSCIDCGKEFTLDRCDRKVRCVKCQEEFNLEKAREASWRFSRSKGWNILGEAANCVHCGTEFERTAGRQKYCSTCAPMAKAMILTDEQRAKTRRYADNWASKNRSKERLRYKRSRAKRKLNPAFTINERMSAGIRYCLKVGKQGSSWLELVDYTLVDLMQHLERQFTSGMTWENRGEWHIDHIRPLCSFEFETPDCPQFREAWALTNLRPLWAKENLEKSGARTLLL